MTQVIQEALDSANVTGLAIGSIETVTGKKITVGNDQEMLQSERNSHSKNRGGKNFIDNRVLSIR